MTKLAIIVLLAVSSGVVAGVIAFEALRLIIIALQ